jgi:hypothetical protein
MNTQQREELKSIEREIRLQNPFWAFNKIHWLALRALGGY